MLNEAQRRVPDHLTPFLSFVRGDTIRDGNLFPNHSFDMIVSRQVVCHLTDPLTAFHHWHTWLKPHGHVMVIDGLWSREGWGNDELVDSLPLSCLQTRRTVAYLLERSAFEIEQCLWLERVNTTLGIITTSPRYLIVARKHDGEE